MIRTLTVSLDAQWAVAREGRKVVLLAGGAAPPVGQLELETEEAELVLLGPPTVLAVVTPTRVTLHQTPYLEQVAHLDLEVPSRLAAVTGPRLVLTSNDGGHVTIVRAAARGLSVQKIEPGSPVEFAVGLERNQVLLGLHKKLEVWDAVSCRPMQRLQLALPPPPRTVGTAQGHLWAARTGSDEVFVYRLSDGRPFRHHVGANVQEVVCHPASPVVVLVTPRGLVRMHCFAHSLLLVDGTPWTPGMPLALLVQGDEVSLIGRPEGDGEPWRVPLLGSGAPAVTLEPEGSEATPVVSAADKVRAMRVSHEPGEPGVRTEGRPAATKGWRDPLVAYAGELVRGIDGDVPVVSVETELGELAHRLGLGSAARRALTTLYALHLVGEPALSIARLARAVGDWTEPLGQGELAALAMIDKQGGKVALRRAVTELIDGAPPCAVRIVGGGTKPVREGAFRVSRDGRADTVIESELVTQLGKIGIAVGDLADALLEARLLGATCVTFVPPGAQPRPWPRGAGLVLVLYGTQSAWIADVPKLELGNES